MSTRQKTILVCMVFVGLCTPTIIKSENSPPPEIELLKAENKRLQTSLKYYQKRLLQVKEDLANESKEKLRLLELCKKAGIDVSIKVDAQFGEIIYRGEKRSKEWFDEMYKKYFDTIALVGGNYIDRGVFENKYARFGQKAKILQVINENELLVTDGDSTYHVHGVVGDYYDDAPFPFRGYIILRTGTYRYTSTLGAAKTVQSCKVYQYKPLTKEQFADALKSGYLLKYLDRKGRRVRIVTVP